MRESRTYGSVRGALSNERPYREHVEGHHPQWESRPPISRAEGLAVTSGARVLESRCRAAGGPPRHRTSFDPQQQSVVLRYKGRMRAFCIRVSQ